jgi:hypothetical protein
MLWPCGSWASYTQKQNKMEPGMVGVGGGGELGNAEALLVFLSSEK